MINNPSFNFSPELKQTEVFEQMKSQIYNLEQIIKRQQGENELLNKSNVILEKEKLKLNSTIVLKDNLIRETTSILDNLKYKIEQLESKISQLEKQNTELNYINFELIKKNKILMNSQSSKNNINPQISSLTEQLNEVSIIKSKLEFDLKNLQNKLIENQNIYENEIKTLTKAKNNEISQKDKIIVELQNGLNLINNPIKNDKQYDINNNKIQYSEMIMNDFSEIENKTKIITEQNNQLKNYINELQNQIKELENLLVLKDKLINELQNKNNEFENEKKLKNEENSNSNSEENFNEAKETQKTVNQLLIEREDLIKQISELKNAQEQFNIGIKEANDLFNEKAKSFENTLISYGRKIKEYQEKLRLSIQEKNKLIDENNKLKREKSKLERKVELQVKSPLLQSKKVNLLNTNSRNYRNNNYDSGNYINETDIHNQNNTFLKTGSRQISLNTNSLININNNFNNEDPYTDSQQKSIDEFKKMLNRVDENLNKGKERIILNEN